MTKPHVTYRILLLIGCVGFLALLLVCIQLNLRWLLSENQRLEPWKIPIIWLSEATGLVLFIQYIVSLILPDRMRSRLYHHMTVRMFVISLCLDAAVSLWSGAEEHLAHARAVRVKAQVVEGRVRAQWPDHTAFMFTYEFQDARGGRHTGWYSHISSHVPVNVKQAIQGGQMPVDVDILYDPSWPGRSWLAELEYSDDNRLFLYSLLTLLFTIVPTIVLMYLNQHSQWMPSPGTGPFFGMIIVLLMAGLIQGR